MRTSLWVTTAILVSVTFAGCIDGTDVDDDETTNPPYSEAFAQGTWPNGQAARDYIESYIMTHPFRSSQPQYADYMTDARDDLEGLLLEAGLDVQRHEYTASTSAITEEDVIGVNILGFQEGTVNPDQWVVLSAHYDSASNVDGGIGPTVYGAWDDGSGTALLIELAHAFKDWEFPFTVVYAMFDQEEEGLLGSQAFVNQYVEDGEHDILANLNTDPPGLNWPCGDQTGSFSVKIIQETDKVEDAGLPRYAWLDDAIMTALDGAEVPEEVRDLTAGIPIATVGGPMPTGVRGTSDHANFGAVDVANVFIGGVPVTTDGNPDDHTFAAMTYGLHTPLDTLQQMEARCTVGSLAEGLQTAADIFAHALIHMAENEPPAAF